MNCFLEQQTQQYGLLDMPSLEAKLLLPAADIQIKSGMIDKLNVLFQRLF